MLSCSFAGRPLCLIHWFENAERCFLRTAASGKGEASNFGVPNGLVLRCANEQFLHILVGCLIFELYT